MSLLYHFLPFIKYLITSLISGLNVLKIVDSDNVPFSSSIISKSPSCPRTLLTNLTNSWLNSAGVGIVTSAP